ncbi:hypothetical protein IEN85_13930 [Pelagicoccus sp. NFK12]|uniref:Uncharacterized protein n=1 Tax=Pelagicoccus enzymogenes TaxID=2773457 RepID=A0A927FA70_9BACT|nr:hypothetical protein [Pelagicoccus enzymogenes]MBD5780596.1 hypothetical protein [Pelagicoccus enzymogenes]
MSLINQALKLEQQKRQTQSGPIPPMAGRAPYRGSSNKMPLLLFGFTGMGMLLAASVTAIFYFGSAFLEADKPVAASLSTPPSVSQSSPAAAAQDTNAEPQLANLLGNLSEDQLSTVQKMLIEREAEYGKQEPSTLDSPSPATTVAPEAEVDLSDISRLQGVVDSFSVQGIRKAGTDTRVFLDGKIRKIGDIVDIENRLQLIGFTESTLVFRDPSGRRFEKAL